MLLKKVAAIVTTVGLAMSFLASCKGNETLPVAPPTEITPRVSEYKNLKYATILNTEPEEQLLDIYKPIGEGIWPIVVLLHAKQGRKEGYIKLSQTIAEQGVVVFTINWPTWIMDIAAKENGKGFREMHEVISCAIRYARANATLYSGDPSTVLLAGHSRGAYNGVLVAFGGGNLGTMWEEYAVTHDGPLSTVECMINDFSPEIDAFLGIGGPYDLYDIFHGRDPELWTIVSPYAFLSQEIDIPIRLIHGEQDDTVPVEVSTEFNHALQMAGFDSKLILHSGSHSVPTELTITEILNMIEEIKD